MDNRFLILLADDRADDRALTEVVLGHELPSARVVAPADPVALGEHVAREVFHGAVIEGRLAWCEPSQLVARLRRANPAAVVVFYSEGGLRVLTPELAELHLAAYYGKSSADLLAIPRALEGGLAVARAAASPPAGFVGAAASPGEASVGDFQQEMLQAVSHDLRQPLQLFTRQLRLLDRNYRPALDEAGGELVASMAKVAEHMDLMLDSILAYYRQGHDGDGSSPAPVGEVIEGVLAAMADSLDEVGATVELGDIPELVVDRGTMARLLQNLLDNAVKFRADRPLVIHIDGLDVPDYWLFTVRDNGLGMDGDRADEAFALFRRLHGQDRYPGSGVGLALCKRIIEQQGGRIWADSTPGVGTAIHFTLPKQGITKKTHRAPVRKSGHDIDSHQGSSDRG